MKTLNTWRKRLNPFSGQPVFSTIMERKKSAFTLVELLIAMTMAIIVIGATLSSITVVYYGQKRLRVSQDFYKEVKLVMQRLVDLSRDNTIDYDRYFLVVGPDSSNCTKFHNDQQPSEGMSSSDDCHSATNNGSSACNNTVNNRAKLGYETIFYWDTNANNEPDRNMGGRVFEKDKAPVVDDCTQAFYNDSVTGNILVPFESGALPALFLINRERELRRAFRRSHYTASIQGTDIELGRIDFQTQLGADTDEDGISDIWGPFDANEDGDFELGDTRLEWHTAGSTAYCRMKVRETSGTKYYDVVGDITNEEFCEQGHDWTPITIRNINIEKLDLSITPDRDPYLAFRNNSVQIHPRVTIRMTSSLTDPVSFGFEEAITISSQTTASSRIFGNTRE
jgi:type II secretory pathway pseudopilin PulG